MKSTLLTCFLSLLLCLCTIQHVAANTVVPTQIEETFFKASNSETEDRFGGSVALDGTTMVVGAPQEDSNATGVNGDQTDNSAANAGAAYVFELVGGTWVQQAYLKASNAEAGDEFGSQVAIEGDTIVVSAFRERSNASGVNGDETDNSLSSAGAVYVFTRSGGTWSQSAYIKASNSGNSQFFGSSLDFSGDTLVVGAPTESGSSTGVNGNQTVQNAGQSGAAYVFFRSGGTWTQEAYLKSSNSESGDRFGTSVAVDDIRIVVGAIGESSNATGVNGNQNDNSLIFPGAVYVFARSLGTWVQEAYVKPSNTAEFDNFGGDVDISGLRFAVGSPNQSTGANYSGAAYVFEMNAGTWSEAAFLKGKPMGNAIMGTVALENDRLVVGAAGTSQFRGAAYLFVRDAGAWRRDGVLINPNANRSYELGNSVAISGGRILCGSSGEASTATGIDPVPLNAFARDSGAAFTYVSGPNVTVADATAPESSGQLTFGLSLPAAAAKDFFVFYETVDGTATAPGDYLAAQDCFRINAGTVAAQLTVTVNGDAIVESPETLGLEVNGVAGIIGTIEDSAPPLPVINLELDFEGVQEGMDIEFIITLSEPSAVPVSFDISTVDGTAMSPEDYAGRSERLTFPVGETELYWSITTLEDFIFDDQETFSGVLSNPENATIGVSMMDVGIVNAPPPPPPEINLVPVFDTVIEGAQLRYRVTLSKPYGAEVKVQIATQEGSAIGFVDYVGGGDLLTFAPGETFKTWSVTTIIDDLAEATETLTVALSSPVNGTLGAVTSIGSSILDDDTPNQVRILDTAGTESSGQAGFRVVLSSIQAGPVSVDYTTIDLTATEGSDYTATSGTAIIPAGTNAVTIVVPIIDDAVPDPAETFGLVLSNPSPGISLANNSAEAHIVDNDGPDPLRPETEIRLDPVTNMICVDWLSGAGWPFVLEASLDLVTWMEVASGVTGGTSTFIETLDLPLQYYRVRLDLSN